jgi:glycosyltransferase involved in cell wall biosynthesis
MRRRPDFVLISSYSEYLSPLWIWPHWILARLFGVTYVANLHDPVRDFQVGPRWWHELSVKMAYWPISIGIVHQRLPEPTPVPAYVRVVEAPVGVYDLQESPENPAEIRAGWGIPDSGVVFLAFGYIRDNKNLDLVIRALAEFPQAHLIVMGKAQSQKDKPVEFYRKLADELDMSGRVKFFATFVPDEKLASYFAAADVVVLTYDKSFHSQSGVLNVAARARRPVLASAGESPLKDCVQKFRLGVFVEPDDMRALKEGIKKISSCEWRASSGEPDWQGYEAFASWDVNVAKILDAVESIKISKRCNSETLRNQSCKK